VIMSPTLFRAPQVPLHPFTRPASRFSWRWPCLRSAIGVIPFR
jgi:hypothetical protein